MDWKTLVIAVAFILLFALVLWLIVSARGKWWLKLSAIVGTLMFCLAVWNAVGSYLGWPAPPPLPQKSVLIWAQVVEPDARSGHPGVIYLWLKVIKQQEGDGPAGSLGYAPEPGEPRAYQLPYSRKLHEQMQGAMELRKKGKTVILEHGKGKPGAGEGDEKGNGKEGQPGPDGKGKEGEKGDGHGSFSNEQEYRFYELPPPKLPEKNKP